MATDYSPKSIQEAWDNHFSAFGEQDLAKILLDYTEESVLTVFDTQTGTKTVFKGLASIGECFTMTFGALSDLSTLKAPVVDVEETIGCGGAGQVFLVWECPGCGFDKATDTFIFDEKFKIARQNVVVVKPVIGLQIGYHRIRGLGAPLRMMAFYKQKSFINKAYASDMRAVWMGTEKPELLKKNACMNLPYIVDGDTVVTQSNTCALYLGSKLGIDKQESFIHNHTVLDQTMDLRNDLMKVVYPFGSVKSKEEFPEGAKKHMAGSATTNFTKLEGFCKGPFMCGAEPQSGDFTLWEMLDQHASICTSLGEANILDNFPKLKALHAALKADPALAKYFQSDFYVNYAQNNAMFTNFTGQAEGFEYGNTTTDVVTF